MEWLGEIPQDWEVKRLKYVASLNDDALSEDTDEDCEIEYVDIGNVDAVKGITATEQVSFGKAPSRARRRVQAGDVIVSTVRTYLRAIASIKARPENLIVSTGFAVVRPRKRLASGYAAHMLRAPFFVEQVVAHSEGVGYPGINASALGFFEVPLPDEGEQRAIAAFLDRETARIDALIEKKEQLIELLEEKRTALITHAVTKGLNPDVPMRESGVEWLGEIPAHWEVKRLWHLTPSYRRIMYGIVLPGPSVDEGVPIVKGGDVSPGRLRLGLLSRTTFEIEAGYARSRLRTGDLVYAIRGSIGQAAMVPAELEGANITQDAARVAYTGRTDGRWLLYALRSAAVFSQVEAGALGATIRGINIRDLKRAVIPLPPQQEQMAIAAFLHRQTGRIDALEIKVREAIERLREYRTALISAAVTGKIDVRGEAA
ncbi:MAG: restriction endonuclease subunit S [Phycisphaerae bacterium]|nr:restriction endonuclease subunit S [Phycisphaerae bacterium]